MIQRLQGNPLKSEAYHQAKHVLTVNDLTKKYHDRAVVNQLHLDVNRGEIFF